MEPGSNWLPYSPKKGCPPLGYLPVAHNHRPHSTAAPSFCNQWDDMQPTIDKIIEQFFSGTKDGIARASALYEDTIFGKEEGAREDFEHCGTVIPNKQMEFDRDDVDRLEGQVTDERLEALWEGAEPTEEERRAYRASVIAQVEDGSADADVIPGYWIYELRYSDGREVFALETVTGHSFSGVTNTFHGLFPSVEDARMDLARWGLVVSG